jgi:hypothetical protein
MIALPEACARNDDPASRVVTAVYFRGTAASAEKRE